MVLSNIPPAISIFFAGVEAADLAALKQIVADGATISDRGTEYRGAAAVEVWLTDLTRCGSVNIRPINVTRRSGLIRVTSLVQGITAESDTPGNQLDWDFTVDGSVLSEISILRTAWPDVPQAVSAFVQSINGLDSSGVIDAFSDDAIVNDQFQNYDGKSAIKGWVSRDVIGDRLTIYITEVRQHYGCTIVTANVDGEYDKRGLPEPLILEFFFEVADGKIVLLIILRNLS